MQPHSSIYTPKFATHFWSRIDKNGPIPTHRPELGPCWEWQGSRIGKGYGHLNVGRNEHHYAHRLAYQLTIGPIPESLFVCHHCDNPPCCNPTHLWAATHQENMQDAGNKGQTGMQVHPESVLRGEKHPSAKLTEDSIQEIRQL